MTSSYAEYVPVPPRTLRCNLIPGVFLRQIVIQRTEIIQQRPGTQLLTGLLPDHLPPVLGGAEAQDVPQPFSHLFVPVIVAVMGILFQNLTGDIFVKLVLDESSQSVIIVLSGIINDVRLGAGVAEFFAARRWGLNPLVLVGVSPPPLIELIDR